MGGHEELQGGNLRASDRDRERVAAALRIHCQDGRITVDELEDRLGKAMAARTLHELAELVVDLPSVAVPQPPATGSRSKPIGPPGIRPFTYRISVPASAGRARSLALDTIAPGLHGFSYELRRQTPDTMEFERSTRPAVAILLAIFLFPFGLFALGMRRKERIVISFESASGARSTMVIHGEASRRVRKAFASLSLD